MFTPRNVSQLLVAKTDVQAAYDAATTNAAKLATLVNVGDYALTYSPAEVPSGSGVTYYDYDSVGLIVKTTNGIKVSEQLNRATLDSYKESTLAAGAAQVLTLTYPAVANSTTYVANVILHDGKGSMLNERIINAYVDIDADGNYINSAGVKASATLDLVTDELAAQLNASFQRSGEGFVATETATTLVVTGAQPSQRIGATDGIANPFELKGGVKPLGAATGAFFTETATLAVTTAAKIDDVVQLKNLEWFMSGYDKDPYRDIAWPLSFEADSNVTAAGIAANDKIGIYQFHKDRDATNVERQHRQLIVVGLAAGSGFSAIDTALKATTTTI